MQKAVLLILDGWGYSEQAKGNAIMAANTPCFDELIQTCPNTLLNASGEHVGLPHGIMGNSEVGHENIGAGRVIKQKLTMISDLIERGEFFQNPVLLKAIEHAKKNNSKLHLMGLISEGDVHAHLGHLDALVNMAEENGIAKEKLFLHAISDGRDDPPYVAEHLIKLYQNGEHDRPKINIATVAGRYWAMDRDNNWDRVRKYYECVTAGLGQHSSTASQAILDGYKLAKDGINTIGDSDEFIFPTVINEAGLIGNNDSVIFFNFRPDRARQLSRLLGTASLVNLSQEDLKVIGDIDPATLQQDHEDLKDVMGVNYIENNLQNLFYACFTDYADNLHLPVAFSSDTLPEQDLSMGIGEIVSKAGFSQFRTAETEKFNHVTSFLNIRHKQAFANEDRKLIPSPKVATYDLQPEMSLPEVTEALLEAMQDQGKDYKFIACNFANPDMVGHTGNWEAVIQALERVDQSLSQVVAKAKELGFVLFVTADHGNADQMLDSGGETRTAHSCNLVPLVVVNSNKEIQLKQFKDNQDLALCNIVPTLLEYLGLNKPKQVNAESLIK